MKPATEIDLEFSSPPMPTITVYETNDKDRSWNFFVLQPTNLPLMPLLYRRVVTNAACCWKAAPLQEAVLALCSHTKCLSASTSLCSTDKLACVQPALSLCWMCNQLVLAYCIWWRLLKEPVCTSVMVDAIEEALYAPSVSGWLWWNPSGFF